MHPLTREMAINHASLDGEPRIVSHGGTMSIVTPGGEIWHVIDSEGPDGETHMAPRNHSRVWARVFVADDDTVRIYRFGREESRSTTARMLLAQLQRAKTGDAQAVLR